MLKAMRETVPEGGLFDRGIEMDIFEGLFDEEISNRMASRHQLGFADLVFRQLSGKLDLGVPIEDILNQVEKVQEKIDEHRIPMHQHGDENESFIPLIQKAAKQFNMDPLLIEAVIRQESNGDPHAVSSKGAKGLMQLIDSTASMLGINNSFNPEENVMGGTQYLKELLNQFDNNIELALASYNAGPGNVRKYGGIPPFKETKDYVKNVLNHYDQLKSVERAE
jgi:Rod binding domain-containing protein